MTLDDVYRLGVQPALTLLPSRMQTPEAVRMLMAIGLQESLFMHRVQVSGPAHGFWQFERIGVAGVMEHHASNDLAFGLCKVLNYSLEVEDVYQAVQHNDVLAAGFARLLLWRLAPPLPTNAGLAWAQYIETWNPGRPRRSLWLENWKTADEFTTRVFQDS
jgi:hypothetical protein